jgi:hypothetical protein
MAPPKQPNHGSRRKGVTGTPGFDPLSTSPVDWEERDTSFLWSVERPCGLGGAERPLTHEAIYRRVLHQHAQAMGIEGKQASARTPCAPRRPPTPWIAAPTWARCRSGSATPTCRPPGPTTAAAPGPRIAPPSAWHIESTRTQTTRNKNRRLTKNTRESFTNGPN